MDALSLTLHDFLFSAVTFVAVIIELWGLFIILTAISKEIYRVVFRYKLDFRMINIDNNLNAGLASALEVLLAAEILKTLTVETYRNLIIIAILIVLRIAMALLLIWESNHKAHIAHPDDH